MRVVAFIIERATVRQILGYVCERTTATPIAPGHTPLLDLNRK